MAHREQISRDGIVKHAKHNKRTIRAILKDILLDGKRMNKEERIEKYGIEAYEKMCQQTRDWGKNHPEEVKAIKQEQSHKGGRNYEQQQRWRSTGLPHERLLVRMTHRNHYRPYKKIIDPEGLTQIHHEWLPETANYRGVALVEKDQHQHGYIDVIQILEGEITLLTEDDVKNSGGQQCKT